MIDAFAPLMPASDKANDCHVWQAFGDYVLTLGFFLQASPNSFAKCTHLAASCVSSGLDCSKPQMGTSDMGKTARMKGWLPR